MSMQTKIVLILSSAMVLGILFYPKIHETIRIDKCLDNGGRWNYSAKICEE